MLPLIREAENAIDEHQGSCRDLLEKLLRLRWERATVSRLSGLAKLLFAETDRYPDLARFYHDEIHEQNQKLIRRAFDQGVAQGEFRPLDSASFALVAIAPILFASIWRQSFGRVVEWWGWRSPRMLISRRPSTFSSAASRRPTPPSSRTVDPPAPGTGACLALFSALLLAGAASAAPARRAHPARPARVTPAVAPPVSTPA